MFRTKTKIGTPSTSFKDATKKRKKNRAKQLAVVPLCENEAQSCQDNDDGDDKHVSKMTTEEGPAKKTESFTTPKRERNLSDMDTPEARTQTRLTLKYDDLLLSQTIDPQCEVFWECISPEVVQKIHRDIQRKPNLDISKILALFTDEDEPPSNSTSNIISNNTVVNTKPHVPCSKKVTPKRRLKSVRKNTTSSKMEDMIRKLEMRIKSEAEEQMADDSMNHKRNPDPLETIQPLQNTSSESQRHTYSNQNLTKCLPDLSEPTSSNTKNTTPLNQNFNSCLVNNEETSWSDDDLFCDESFIAKVTQTSENKTNIQIDENKSSLVDIFSERLFTADKKTSFTSCKTSSLGLKNTDTNKHKEKKTESNREFPKTSKSAIIINVGNTDMKPVHQSNNSGANNLLQDDLDIGFSDSETDEILSQLTEQEICCAIQSSDKKNCFVTENVSVENSTGLSNSVPGVTVDGKTDKKNSVDSYLNFLDIPSNSCRKPSPGKPSMSVDVSSTKKKAFNFKSIKNNKFTNNISATCSVPSKQNDIGPALDISFDDPFSDNDDILKFAESLDRTESNVQEATSEVMKTPSYRPASKQIASKAKIVCTKEEIERKKREALNRRRKFGAITKCNMK